MQTEQTQRRYQIRALQLIRQAEHDSGEEALTAPQMAQWLIDRQGHYSKSTWRQYRAALMAVFNPAMASDPQCLEEFTEARFLLQQCPPPAGRPSQKKTSAQKQKKLADPDLWRLFEHFEVHPARHGVATLTWLMAGIWTGLRPGEWETAVLNEDEKVLLVQNAKATNDRAHGPTRVIQLSALAPDEWDILRQQLVNVQQACREPIQNGQSGFERFYHHCRTCLYKATRTLWPRRQRFISLYSARHQFAANAKFSGLSLAQIAALMGHRSTTTATAHYGRRAAGNGGFKVEADQADVARVQAFNRPQAEEDPEGLRL